MLSFLWNGHPLGQNVTQTEKNLGFIIKMFIMQYNELFFINVRTKLKNYLRRNMHPLSVSLY